MKGILGYVIPEFPGATHIWMWREITHLREWGVPIQIFSTRPPSSRDKARHAFAEQATAETIYLWPLGLAKSLTTALWAATRPLALARCIALALTLPVEQRPRWRRVLPLVLPACVLAREAKRTGVSRLHSHTCANGAILCMMVKRLANLPFSMTLNANVEWWGGAMREKLDDADFTIVITKWLEEQVRHDFPSLSPAKVVMGRIGVDTQKWVPATAAPIPSAEHLRVITVGRLHESKGHSVLLEALESILKEGIEFTLTIIGDGPERGKLERSVEQAGLKDRVRFLGSQGEDRIIEEMKHSDVFVLASHAEPLGVVYMEAMAMEVATIGTAAGGVGEIITDAEDGLLVPPKDPMALADALKKLASDPALRQRIARAGRRSIMDRFDSRRGAATLYERIFGVDSPATLV